MKIIVEKNYEEMSQMAANYMLHYMTMERPVNLAITAGRTPKRMYELLVPLVKNRSCFKNVHYYNFDEIPFKGLDCEPVTIGNLRKSYFTPAHIFEENIHPLTMENYAKHDERLRAVNGLDMIMIGLGADGHYCGNSPGATRFGDSTIKGKILPEEIQSIADTDMNGDTSLVPDEFVTMGPKSVMNAKNIVMIVNGSEKAEMVKRIIEGEVDEMVPASILPLHPSLTVILDAEAAALLSPKTLSAYR
ncbi:glucosamine-6-phosphate deaminase [Enterococcus hulanensis]|uniref:glucosamine-6-phosphate deaminase n=1 Tax=Enterococcus hulanensis TaxID=2559929 RepID=UPI001A8EF25A|nr:glucosamine-6-phosphate deaminase [Enterococcus hulanensis]MBO0457644.1 glucosamine-6-phosphate deaminase [Enterococcus hulanensis]